MKRSNVLPLVLAASSVLMVFGVSDPVSAVGDGCSAGTPVYDDYKIDKFAWPDDHGHNNGIGWPDDTPEGDWEYVATAAATGSAHNDWRDGQIEDHHLTICWMSSGGGQN